MNWIFYILILISVVAGVVNGRLEAVVNSILSGAELSVKVAFSLIGIMAFWLGMMKIAEKSGLIAFISRLIKPITKFLFSEIPEDSPAMGDIAMSLDCLMRQLLSGLKLWRKCRSIILIKNPHQMLCVCFWL